MKMIKRLLYWIPVLIVLAGIFYLSSKSSYSRVWFLDFPFSDKIIHLIEYSILSWLVYRSLYYCEKIKLRNAVFITIFFTAFYGFTDEMHQYFVPERDASFFDWVFDCLGAILPLGFIRDVTQLKKGIKCQE